MNFKEKKELREKADKVFEETLNIVFDNNTKDNIINDLWNLSKLGENLARNDYKLEEMEELPIDTMSKEDKKIISDLSEERIKIKLEYYKLFLKIIKKYNK